MDGASTGMPMQFLSSKPVAGVCEFRSCRFESQRSLCKDSRAISLLADECASRKGELSFIVGKLLQ